jgi:hypothetical protein
MLMNVPVARVAVAMAAGPSIEHKRAHGDSTLNTSCDAGRGSFAAKEVPTQRGTVGRRTAVGTSEAEKGCGGGGGAALWTQHGTDALSGSWIEDLGKTLVGHTRHRRNLRRRGTPRRNRDV